MSVRRRLNLEECCCYLEANIDGFEEAGVGNVHLADASNYSDAEMLGAPSLGGAALLSVRPALHRADCALLCTTTLSTYI